jgi:hypothetical protein
MQWLGEHAPKPAPYYDPQGGADFVKGANSPLSVQPAVQQAMALASAPAASTTEPARIPGSAAGDPPAPTQAGTALAAGLHRFNDGANGPQGIYAARMKDGSLGFTDDAGGLTNFGSGIDARGLKRSDISNAAPSNAGAYTGDVSRGGHVYGPNDALPTAGDYNATHGLPAMTARSPLQADGLYRSMMGGGAPNADRAYASSSGVTEDGQSLNPAMLDSMNPMQIQNASDRLMGANTAGNPELAQANGIALSKLRARAQDFQQGDYPGGPRSGQSGGMGTPGMMGGGMMPGMKMSDVIALRGQQLKSGVDQAKFGLDERREQREAAATQQGIVDKSNQDYNNAPSPAQQDAQAMQAIPQYDDSPAGRRAAASFARSRMGQAAFGNALQSLKRSAHDEQWGSSFLPEAMMGSGGGTPIHNLDWDNVIKDEQGNFTGFRDSPGGFNIAPVDPALQSSKYSPALVKRISPYLKYLQTGQALAGTTGTDNT